MMFSFKRNIIIVFCVLFILLIINCISYKYIVFKQTIIPEIVKNHRKFAEIYQLRIWNENKEAINILEKAGRIKGINSIYSDKFIKDSTNYFKQFSYLQVNLYDPQGNKFLYSNINNPFLPINDLNMYNKVKSFIDQFFLKNFLYQEQGLEMAFSGKSTYSIFLNSNLLISYIPIIDNNFTDFVIDGVLEIISDFSQEWKIIDQISNQALIVSMVILFIALMLLLFYFNHANKIISNEIIAKQYLKKVKNNVEIENFERMQFFANITHELRTPLNVIIGFSDMILSQIYGKIENEKYLDYISNINTSGKDLLNIINDILDLSKISVEKLKINLIEVDLNRSISSSIKMLEQQALEKNIKINIQIPVEKIIIKIDTKRFKQILINIVSNAIKFTDKGSIIIDLSLDLLQKLAIIKIQDSGIGIAERDIPKILSGFEQVDHSLNKKYSGSGLGIPLSKKLTELMRGTFNIKSVEGKGTTVILTFPL